MHAGFWPQSLQENWQLKYFVGLVSTLQCIVVSVLIQVFSSLHHCVSLCQQGRLLYVLISVDMAMTCTSL